MELKITAKAKVVNKDGVLARISFNISDFIYVVGCTLRQGKNGVFLSMPSWKDSKGQYNDFVYGNKAVMARLLEIAKEAFEAEAKTAPVKEEAADLPF